MKKKEKISRRNFFSLVGFGVMWTTLMGSAVVMFKFLFPNVLNEPLSTFKVGIPSDFPVGSSHFFEERKVFLFHDVNGFYTFSAVCPHLGCLVTRPPQGGFFCPCHGSVFDDNGNVLKKPAVRRLDSFRVSLTRDGKIQIDQSEKVDENFRLKA